MGFFTRWLQSGGAVAGPASSPRLPGVQPDGGSPGPPEPDGRAPTDVLVVEDDDSLGDLVARNLVAHGYDVRRAGDAGSALDRLRERRPKVLILDINLPDSTGWDILRTRWLDESTAVIVLTAVPVSPKRLGEFRPVAYLPKPFPLEALLRLVARSAAREQRDASRP